VKKYTVEIGGNEFEICYNTKAMTELEKICDNLSNVGEWLNDSGTDSEKFKKICNVITILINGAVFRHNAEIAIGLAEGEKKPSIEYEDLMCIITPAEALKVAENVFKCINESISFKAPDGEETDPDLLETESEKKD